MWSGAETTNIKVTQIWLSLRPPIFNSQMTQIFDLCGHKITQIFFSLDFAELSDEKSASSAKSA